jgi:heme-degrading monooxygenase HmoA
MGVKRGGCMIKHIVMWKVKEVYEGKNKDELIAELKSKLESLKDSVPGVKSLEVGKNISKSAYAQDIILVTEFENQDALDNYRRHPEHLKVVDYIKNVVEAGYALDYISD